MAMMMEMETIKAEVEDVGGRSRGGIGSGVSGERSNKDGFQRRKYT